MNILVRADSSSQIGTGHIMRDFVLVKQYENDNIIFAVQDLQGNINHKIDELEYEKIILKTNNFEELDNLIKKIKVDMIIIDHYGIDYKFEENLKKSNSNLKIFVFDDTYEKHYCDILLNHNIYGDKKKYKNLVPDFCEIRCGSKFMLLRDEFIEAKQLKKTIINDKFTFFIAIGGSDLFNLNPKIIEVLSVFTNIEVNIVTTYANLKLDELIEYCEKKDWVNLHVNCNHMAKIIAQSDLAIITPSVTSNEVYFMKTPFIAIKIAENQNEMYAFLKKEGFSVLEKFDPEKLLLKVKQEIKI